MAYDQIITTVVIVLLSVFGLVFLLRGLHRGLIKALMTTGNIVLSAFLACFMSRDFTTIARDYVYPLFVWITGLFGLDLEGQLGEYEQIIELLPMLIGVLITPFLFLSFFFVIHAIIGFIFLFIHRPRRKATDEEGNTVRVKRYVPVWSRITGACVGVLNGALLLGVLLLPITGYVNMAANVSNAYFEELDTTEYTRQGGSVNETIYYAVNDYVKPITEQWYLKATYRTFGRPMFTHMTSTAYGSGAFSMENEAIVGIDLVRSLIRFGQNDMTGSPKQSVEAMKEIVVTLDRSTLMPEMMATLVSELCDNWLQGGTLLGMPRPALGELLDPTFDVLLELLVTVDGEILIQDLNTLIDVMDLMIENGLFGSIDDSNQMMDSMSKSPELLGQMMDLFEENEHLAPMAAEIRRLCMRIVAQSLDLGDEELTGKLTDTVNAHKNDPEDLSQALSDLMQDFLDEQNVDATVSPEMTAEVAELISREFADHPEVTEQELIDFVMNYAAGAVGEGDLNLDGTVTGDR